MLVPTADDHGSGYRNAVLIARAVGYLNSFRIALPAASAVNGPALPSSDDKVGAEIQPGVNAGVTGGGGPARLHRR